MYIERQSGYDVITIESGEHRIFDVHDDFDGVMENILFDCTSDDSSIEIDGNQGPSFTIRNVAVDGILDNHELSDHNLLKIRLDDGEVGEIINCYFGDGCYEGQEHGNNGLQHSDESSGTLYMDGVNIQWFDDNGCYAAEAKDSGGTNEIQNCYFAHNNISQLRLGGDGAYVRNSTLWTDVNEQNCGGQRGGNRDCGEKALRMERGSNGVLAENCNIFSTGRAVHVIENTSGTIRDCEISGSIDVEDSTLDEENIGDNPENVVPDGCPSAPLEAVEGDNGGSGDESALPIATIIILVAGIAIVSILRN